MFHDEETAMEMWVLGDRYRFLHLAADYATIEVFSTQSHGPPLHRHHREAEFLYVLEGELDLQAEEHHRILRPGDSIHLPPGHAHGYRTRTPASRHIAVIVPGHFAQLFLEIGHPREHDGDLPHDVEKLRSLAPRYGHEILTSTVSPGQGK